jgi:hypothetical protein
MNLENLKEKSEVVAIVEESAIKEWFSRGERYKGQLTGEETIPQVERFVNSEQMLVNKLGKEKYLKMLWLRDFLKGAGEVNRLSSPEEILLYRRLKAQKRRP